MEKIRASLVFEIMGRPAEHVKETLNTQVVRLGSEKGIKVLSKTYHEPIPLEGSKDIFTAFADIEAEFESVLLFYVVIFSYLPSHVEVIKPEKFEISNVMVSEIGTVLLQKLYEYDAVTRTVVADRDILIRRLKEIDPKFFEHPAAPPSLQQSAKNISSPVKDIKSKPETKKKRR